MFKALLETGRISNLPTVWSNVLVSFVFIYAQSPSLSYQTGIPVRHLTLLGFPLLIACISASLLYVGGCFLGDAIDANFDKKHKPDRPIPSGILKQNSVLSSAIAMLTIGSLLPFSTSPTIDTSLLLSVAALTSSIVLYSWLHKKSPWLGLPLIGACRFFLALFGATTAWSSAMTISFEQIPTMYLWIILSYAGCVAAYTICFASVARSESSPKPITWRKVLIPTMLFLPFALLISIWAHSPVSISITELLANLSSQPFFPALLLAYMTYVGWLILAFISLKSNKGVFVSMCLAGFCLLDTVFIAGNSWSLAFTGMILFLTSLALQRWAPAT